MTFSASHDTRGPQTRTACSPQSVSTMTLVHQGLYVLHGLENLDGISVGLGAEYGQEETFYHLIWTPVLALLLLNLGL